MSVGDGSGVLDELRWRGLIAQTTDEEALRAALDGGPVTVYCGFDPTAPSLHFGNLVQLITLRHLRRAGHRVIGLVGGSTGLIGDPRPSSERTLKTKEQTAADTARIAAQVERILGAEEGQAPLFVNNLDWTAPISAIDFLREYGKHFRVNQMIRKDAVAARLSSEQGISYTEFSYQVLQALDYLHLYREHGCTVQTGAQDQWGNITAGVDLIHRTEGVSVHALTTPLITDSEGRKFGKSEGNAVWLDPTMTSPYAFYQYWVGVEDASVISLLKVFTDLGAEDIAALEAALIDAPQQRAAQRTLAREVTTLVHGEATAAAVEEASRALFSGGALTGLDPSTLADAAAELPGAVVAPGTAIADVLVAVGLVTSKKAARRALDEGSVAVNGVKVTDEDRRLEDADYLGGSGTGVAVVRRGRRQLAAAWESEPGTNRA